MKTPAIFLTHLLLLSFLSCGIQVDRNTTRIANSTEQLSGVSLELTQLFTDFVNTFQELNISLKELAVLAQLEPDIRFLIGEAKQYIVQVKEEESSRDSDEFLEPDFKEEK